ncbi:MAG: hypothetical protein O7D94_11195 [Planctomycetota bacterium]|nr:hypothetical protein [Planctomycetota bacterium]
MSVARGASRGLPDELRTPFADANLPSIPDPAFALAGLVASCPHAEGQVFEGGAQLFEHAGESDYFGRPQKAPSAVTTGWRMHCRM